MREHVQHVHPPSPTALSLVAGVVTGAFWLSVVAQVLLGRPTAGELLVANGVVVLASALLVGLGTASVQPAGADGATPIERAKTLLAWLLAVPAIYLAVGVVAHALVFEGLLAGEPTGVAYPHAVGRWFVVLLALWIGLVLVAGAAGTLAGWFRRTVVA